MKQTVKHPDRVRQTDKDRDRRRDRVGQTEILVDNGEVKEQALRLTDRARAGRSSLYQRKGLAG